LTNDTRPAALRPAPSIQPEPPVADYYDGVLGIDADAPGVSARTHIDPNGDLWNAVIASTGQPRNMR
jgi:hypothetical protein